MQNRLKLKTEKYLSLDLSPLLCRKILSCRICRMIRMYASTVGFNLYVILLNEMQIQPLFWHHVEYWMCCAGFEWNKHRCTYVHWRIYCSRYLDTLLYKVQVKIWIEILTGLYTNATIDMRRLSDVFIPFFSCTTAQTKFTVAAVPCIIISNPLQFPYVKLKFWGCQWQCFEISKLKVTTVLPPQTWGIWWVFGCKLWSFDQIFLMSVQCFASQIVTCGH